MHAFLIILFMVVIGAIIGGITNIIAIRMLFHPYRPHYFLKIRIPFTPGLIPKRRGEIATKIGQVIEEHLLTEKLIRQKLMQPETKQSIQDMIQHQISRLRKDRVTLQQVAQKLNFDMEHFVISKMPSEVEKLFIQFYKDHKQKTIEDILPKSMMDLAEDKIDTLEALLIDRVHRYLTSTRGRHDIEDMLDTFFLEKGKIIGLLQMFMTKESIAERIQHELIRLTHHPKANAILKNIIRNEYTTFKGKKLNEIVSMEQVRQIATSCAEMAAVSNKVNIPLSDLAPKLFNYLEQHIAKQLTQVAIQFLSTELATIMKKFNLRAVIEEQINTFDLDYIERLIIDIAKKELNLIMSLGFLLGGIIGLLQGIVAIFV
ncbi:DUF445 domain-containing protein [Staphylococcus lugdunensis]|nr:DUF445 family protein [Staphylococcus lugdunensis]SQE71443.1 membrane protein [Staphylococcus lugdunensis]